jgi:hypothetical protein
MGNEKSAALEYARRVFDGVLDWYKNADSKAQIILSLDGAFLAFLTSSIFMEQDKLSKILSRFGLETWILLGLMCISLIGSILSAIFCLWSRIYNEDELDVILKSEGVEFENSATYKPQFMLFFQFLSRLQPKRIAERFSVINEEYEIEALAFQMQIISQNVMNKHYWVDRGFVLVGLSLLFFLSAGISYVLRVGV